MKSIKRRSKIRIILGFSLIGIGLLALSNCIITDLYIKRTEKKNIEEFLHNQEIVDYQEVIIEEDNTITIPNNITHNTNTYDDYIAVIEIPKINLKKGLYDLKSAKNNYTKNIEILAESDMPNTINGNFILAAHAGIGRIAYFKDLHKLSKDDVAYVYYQKIKYTYRVLNTIEFKKNNKLSLIRNPNKTTLTMITCVHNTDKQIAVISELINREDMIQ